jgi:hypothetical protein
VAARASATTFSRTVMYSRNRPRPTSVTRQVVWGRFRSNPLQTSTKPASWRTWRCRLRLPSVRAHSSFRSEKRRPLGLVTSEVMIPSLAFSWKTRSSPS